MSTKPVQPVSSKNDGPPSWIRHTSIGFEFFATIVGCALVGLWVDRKWQTAPWGVLTGSFVGLVVGFYNFLRTALGILGPPKKKPEKAVPEQDVPSTRSAPNTKSES